MRKLIKSTKQPQTSRLFSLLSASLAFMLWGGWAFYINEISKPESGLISGITQGTASFIITLVMVHMVTWFYRHISGTKPKLILPAVLTVIITGSCLVSIHYYLGTPQIIYTISPALSVAFIFNLFTTYKLNQMHKNRRN